MSSMAWARSKLKGKTCLPKLSPAAQGAFRGVSGELIHEDINVENASFRATFTN